MRRTKTYEHPVNSRFHMTWIIGGKMKKRKHYQIDRWKKFL